MWCCAARGKQVDEARQRGEATVPSTLGEELDTNPFLRPGSPAIRQHLGFSPSDPDHQVFAAVRKAKDRF